MPTNSISINLSDNELVKNLANNSSSKIARSDEDLFYISSEQTA